MGAVLVVSGALWAESSGTEALPVPKETTVASAAFDSERSINLDTSLVVVVDEWEATSNGTMSKKVISKKKYRYNQYRKQYWSFYNFFLPVYGGIKDYNATFYDQFNFYWSYYYAFRLQQQILNNSANP